MDTHSSPFICSVYTLAFLMSCTTDDPIKVATASSQSDIADLFFAPFLKLSYFRTLSSLLTSSSCETIGRPYFLGRSSTRSMFDIYRTGVAPIFIGIFISIDSVAPSDVERVIMFD